MTVRLTAQQLRDSVADSIALAKAHLHNDDAGALAIVRANADAFEALIAGQTVLNACCVLIIERTTGIPADRLINALRDGTSSGIERLIERLGLGDETC